jgi:simple sugar transport system permease protein
MRIFQFSPDQIGGRGFLVLALVIFGRWNILGLIAGCLLFGLTDDLQRYLQGYAFAQHVPEDVFKMLPYIATLAALAVLTRTKAAPAHLGRPWPEA